MANHAPYLPISPTSDSWWFLWRWFWGFSWPTVGSVSAECCAGTALAACLACIWWAAGLESRPLLATLALVVCHRVDQRRLVYVAVRFSPCQRCDPICCICVARSSFSWKAVIRSAATGRWRRDPWYFTRSRSLCGTSASRFELHVVARRAIGTWQSASGATDGVCSRRRPGAQRR